ncbi:MAG: response regulator [Bdellovibrionia bacterium]
MSKLILVVEDDEVIRENLQEILEMEGYAVVLARHGKEALEILRSQSATPTALPFMLLLDLNMPVMPGPEFLKALKNEPANLATIPVVVMTAVPDAGALDAVAILRKPIDLDDLLSRIQSLAPATT